MRGTKTVVLNEKKGEKMKTKTQTRCAAGLEYTLEIKAVKRLNLRLRRDGSIALSVPPGTPAAVADDFVQRKADWLRTARQRVLAREQALQRRQPPTRGECAAVFARADAKIWPLFRQALGGRKPDIRMRPMETRWGVCSPAQYRITLSTWLALEPMEAVEYVLLHEYAHFFHPSHQAQFWALVESLMPDWKRRRQMLRHTGEEL